MVQNMTALTKPRMTVDQFLAWAMEQPKRYELFQGEVYAMSPETLGHAKIKGLVYTALGAGLRKRNLDCHAVPDGMTLRIDNETAYEPDALVYCGQELPLSMIEVPNPVIVVEVLSPSTRHVDGSLRLAGYFRLPSVMHYLIINPNQPTVIHHTRSTGDTILTRVITDGVIKLDPPGLELAVSDIYGT
jgi:Uma2 family endonuclease